VNRQRIRRGFGALADAEAFCTVKRDELRAQGMNALVLPERDKADARRALEILRPVGGTLIQAAEEYARRHPATVTETFRETCQRYLAAMEKEGRRQASINDKRVKFGKLCEGLGGRPVASVDDLDVKTWVEEQGFTNGTGRAYAGAAKSALSFFRGEKRERRATDEKPPVTWSVATVRKIMQAAENSVPEFVPALAVLFFAGCRPDEVKRLTWDAIKLDDREIHLTGEITKTRTTRHVHIEDNLLQWLAAYRGTGLLVSSPGRYLKSRLAVMKAAGVDGWPVDVARHTFATALYNSTGDAAKVMQALGHFGSADTFTRHYKGVPMSKRDAAAYFKIGPEAAENVLLLRQTA
jgi:integrase